MTRREQDVGAFERVTLRNGATAVRHKGHGEIMHPSVGPWAEANALYVDQAGLPDALRVPGVPLVLMDVGLGACPWSMRWTRSASRWRIRRAFPSSCPLRRRAGR